jgi:hypothetical protein
MKQQQVEFKAVGYITEFIVDGNDVYMIFNNKIIKERHCSTHDEAEAIRTELVNEFWGFRLN